MPHEGIFQPQTDLPSIAALQLLGENFKTFKYGTRGYDQRIIGQPSSSFQGLISAKSQNFDAG